MKDKKFIILCLICISMWIYQTHQINSLKNELDDAHYEISKISSNLEETKNQLENIQGFSSSTSITELEDRILDIENHIEDISNDISFLDSEINDINLYGPRYM